VEAEVEPVITHAVLVALVAVVLEVLTAVQTQVQEARTQVVVVVHFVEMVYKALLQVQAVLEYLL
jgi:hypothetical protein